MNLAKLKQFLKRLSHRSIIVLIGLFIIVLLWSSVSFLIHREYQTTVEGIQRENSNLAKAFEEHVRRMLLNVSIQLKMIGGEYERENAVTPALRALLGVETHDPAVSQFSVVDKLGNYVASISLPAPGDRNVADREYFRSLSVSGMTGIYVDKPSIDAITGKWSIHLSYRMSNPDNSFKGIVSVALSSDYFRQFYKQMELGDGRMVVLVGLDGIIRVNIENEAIQTRMDINESDIYLHAKKSSADSIETTSTFDGQQRFVSYRFMPDYPLFVMVGTPKEQALASYQQRSKVYLFFAFLASLFVVAAGYLIVRHRENEVLAQKALQEAYDGLEKQVEDRTQDLFAANQELTAMNEEMTAMNQTLQGMNQQLEEEVAARQQKEYELSIRERQFHALASLLIQPVEQTDALMQTILKDTLQLLNAPEGSIGLYDESRRAFVLRYAIGTAETDMEAPQPIDKGLHAEVYRTGEAAWVEDYRIYEQRLPYPRLQRLTTIISVPLFREGIIIGVLSANWVDVPHRPTQEELDILRQYGNFASVALERAGIQAKIAQQNQLLRTLAQTTNAVIGQLDLDSIFQEILESASGLLGVPHGFILMFQNDKNAMQFISVKGNYAEKSGNQFPIAGIAAKVMESGAIFYVEDYRSWPEQVTGPLYEDITMSVQAPLKLDGKTVGTIGLSAFSEKAVLDDEKLAILDQFAAMASVALKNAILHKDTVTLAFHDKLTGLPNRASLSVRLADEMQRAKRGEAVGVVMFIDLDDLKTVNDNYGHSAGDEVIVTASKHIVDAVGPDTYVARIGGDEFIVILSGESYRKNAKAVADKLIKLLSQEYEVSGALIHLSASLGAAYYPEDGDNAEDILKKADSAMYVAKTAGKDCWRFYESHIGDESYNRMILTNSLRRALDRGELSLHFQPQISCDSKQIIGFEALLRWNSTEHGAVAPVRFIPLAEQSGLIRLIGQFVLMEACRFIRRLNEIGFPHLRVAVNISPRQLAAEDFVDVVNLCLVKTGIRADQLEIEITENVLIESIEGSIQKLLALKEMGVYLTLDDFGTGYSSLTYLRHLPVSCLKIDKVFIDPILGNETEERFVYFIIEMAHSLNLKVIAEGVEEKPQVDKLVSLGCDIIQGYVFSRPIPPDDAIKLLKI